MKNLLIVSPYYIPFAGVGANRMKSLVNSIREESYFNVFILKNDIASYGEKITDEEVPVDITIIECKIKSNFLRNVKLYKKKVSEIFCDYKIDGVLISVGPFFTLPLVSFIKKRYNIPVILDVRDFWAHEPITNDLYRGIKTEVKSFFKDYFFERKALCHADQIVVMGTKEIDFLSKIYGNKIGSKLISIPNGYDDYLLKKEKNRDKIIQNEHDLSVCVYGKYAEYISNKRILETAEAMLQFKRKYRNISFIQIGHPEKIIKDVFDEKEVDYVSKGYMEYANGMNYLSNNADILMLSSDLEGVGLGTKIYDYIFCNKPIIYMGSQTTELAAFVSSFKNGFVCDNSEKLYTALEKIYLNNIKCLDECLDNKRFARSRQNKKYIELLKNEI